MRDPRYAPANLLNVAPLTCGLMVTCILLYLVSLVQTMQTGGSRGFGGISHDVLMGYGMASAPQLWSGRWLHLVMPMFLHGSAMHILFNMMALYQLGPSLEAHFGTSNFGSVYFLSGIFGTCVTLLVTGGPSVGASGAIFGMLGAVLAVKVVACHDFSRAMKNSEVRRAAKYIAFLFLICFLLPNVDHYGHFGGLVAGCLYGWLFETWRKRRVIGPLVLAGMLSITIVAIGLARWTFYSPQYHYVLASEALKEGDTKEWFEQYKKTIEWQYYWRGLPPPDFRGFELPSVDAVDGVPAPEAPEPPNLAPEKTVQPPAAGETGAEAANGDAP